MHSRFSTVLFCLSIASIGVAAAAWIGREVIGQWAGQWTAQLSLLSGLMAVVLLTTAWVLSAVIGRHARLVRQDAAQAFCRIWYLYLFRYGAHPLRPEDLWADAEDDPGGIVNCYESGTGWTDDPLEYGAWLVEHLPDFADYLRTQPDGSSIIQRLLEGQRRYECARKVLIGEVPVVPVDAEPPAVCENDSGGGVLTAEPAMP